MSFMGMYIVSHRGECKLKAVHTSSYQVWNPAVWYVLVYTSIYRYIPVHTKTTIFIHMVRIPDDPDTPAWIRIIILVYTSIYKYMIVYTSYTSIYLYIQLYAYIQVYAHEVARGLPASFRRQAYRGYLWIPGWIPPDDLRPRGSTGIPVKRADH